MRRRGTLRRSVGLGVEKVTGVYNKMGPSQRERRKRGNIIKERGRHPIPMKRKYTDNIVSRKKPVRPPNASKENEAEKEKSRK